MIINNEYFEIIRYEFNKYIIVDLDGVNYTLPFETIAFFISNEMTNGFTTVLDEHYIYLYELLKEYINK